MKPDTTHTWVFMRPRPLALFLFLLCFCTTVGLGTWQVHRLQWKTQLIASIASAKSMPPLTMMPTDNSTLQRHEFYPVRLRGTWMGDREFHISPRFYKGKLGYFVVSPFLLTDGRTLMVNRGWVPTEKKEAVSRPESLVSGMETISGMIRIGNERNYFTPPNASERNLWFGRDVAQMADRAHLSNVIPAMVDIVGTQDTGHLPVPSDGTIRLTNDHLSYIITWYGIAAGILIIFLLSLRKRRTHGDL